MVGAEDEETDEIIEDEEGQEKEQVEGDDEEMEEEFDAELDALVRRGIAYSKKWDRMAKLKSADGRAGWERHVIGALCQVSAHLSSDTNDKPTPLALTAWWTPRHAQPHSHPRSPL